MKRLLYIILYIALAATASAQEAIDTAQFVAVYDYECRTQDDEGTPVTDRMQLAVQVGRTVTKSMPLSAYQRTDEITSADAAIEFQEAMLHMPTVWTGYPEGQTTVREFIFPHDYECTTQDAEGLSVTDKMQVVVQVGRMVTKSMPRSVYRQRDESERVRLALGFYYQSRQTAQPPRPC